MISRPAIAEKDFPGAIRARARLCPRIQGLEGAAPSAPGAVGVGEIDTAEQVFHFPFRPPAPLRRRRSGALQLVRADRATNLESHADEDRYSSEGVAVKWLNSAVAGAALLVAGALRAVAAPVACPGDCNGDGVVAIDELVAGVAQALSTASGGACGAFDRDGNGSVSIAELIAAVAAALEGCPPEVVAFTA